MGANMSGGFVALSLVGIGAVVGGYTGFTYVTELTGSPVAGMVGAYFGAQLGIFVGMKGIEMLGQASPNYRT